MSEDYISDALRRIEAKVEETNRLAQQTRVDVAGISTSQTHQGVLVVAAQKRADDAHALATEVKTSHDQFVTKVAAWAAGVAFAVTALVTLIKEGLLAAFRG